jgi:hypothetical protein
MRCVAMLLLLAVAGCREPEDTEPRAERAGAEAFRKEMLSMLRKAKALTLTRWCPMDDGGSNAFFFRTDAHDAFIVLMKHDRRHKRGNPEYQEFRIEGAGSTTECEVERNSELERLLVNLLHHGDVKLVLRSGLEWKPTPEAVPWLQRRLVDRTIPFDSPPHVR